MTRDVLIYFELRNCLRATFSKFRYEARLMKIGLILEVEPIFINKPSRKLLKVAEGSSKRAVSLFKVFDYTRAKCPPSVFLKSFLFCRLMAIVLSFT